MEELTLWIVESKELFVESIIKPEGGRLPTQSELYKYKLYQAQKFLDNRHIGGIIRVIGWQHKPIETPFIDVYKRKDRI